MESKKGRPTISKLTCKEIIDIIKCGNEEQVEKLTFGDLSVQYQARCIELTDSMEAGPLPISELENAMESYTSEQELKIKEEELALLAIENPAEYEEALARGDLTENDNDTN